MKNNSKVVLLSLISITLFSLFMRTIPLFRYSMWGMDCGEYVYYTGKWVSTGSSYLNIDGWGQAYPYFPGLFVLSGSLSSITGISVLSSTVFLPVIVSSFVPLFVFLIAYKITIEWKSALLSSFFLSVVAPFVYNYSQPKPETLGFFLMALLLIFFVFLSKNTKKYYVLIIPTCLALVVTHHLSTYFLILFMFGGVFFSELSNRKSIENNLYRFYSYLLVTVVAIFYWMVYADPFRRNRLYQALGTPYYTILLSPFVVPIFAYLLIKLRRKKDYILPINIHRQNFKSFLKFALPPIIIGIVILLMAGFYRVPGREFKLGYHALIYVPLLFLSVLSVEARKVIKVFREGMHVVGWFLLASMSMFLGLLTENSSLLPMRQLSFLLMPLSILLGLGIIQIVTLYNPFKKKNRNIILAIVAASLLLWSIPFTYPAQESISGYQEGSEWDDVEAGVWSTQIEGKIATDHRMSAVLFASGNDNLTWTEGFNIYFSSVDSDIRNELDELNISYILWDQDMLKGVATAPGRTPYRFDESAFEY
ncbi:MAG: hypothetical protein ACOCSL_01165 [Thermoplasmatota archaeon]